MSGGGGGKILNFLLVCKLQIRSPTPVSVIFFKLETIYDEFGYDLGI